jgi:hypothetical protein
VTYMQGEHGETGHQCQRLGEEADKQSAAETLLLSVVS